MRISFSTTPPSGPVRSSSAEDGCSAIRDASASDVWPFAFDCAAPQLTYVNERACAVRITSNHFPISTNAISNDATSNELIGAAEVADPFVLMDAPLIDPIGWAVGVVAVAATMMLMTLKMYAAFVPVRAAAILPSALSTLPMPPHSA
jgi:hypothetical protein